MWCMQQWHEPCCKEADAPRNNEDDTCHRYQQFTGFAESQSISMKVSSTV